MPPTKKGIGLFKKHKEIYIELYANLNQNNKNTRIKLNKTKELITNMLSKSPYMYENNIKKYLN